MEEDERAIARRPFSDSPEKEERNNRLVATEHSFSGRESLFGVGEINLEGKESQRQFRCSALYATAYFFAFLARKSRAFDALNSIYCIKFIDIEKN